MPPGWVLQWLALSKEGLERGRIFQLITFQFLHAGVWHLLGIDGDSTFSGVLRWMPAGGMLAKLYFASEQSWPPQVQVI